MREERSGCLVLICSLIIPGLGQIIQGRLFAGFSLFIIAFFLWIIFWTEVTMLLIDLPYLHNLPPPSSMEIVLSIGLRLAICLIHLWSVADTARWKGK